jgi:hypothetical protein
MAFSVPQKRKLTLSYFRLIHRGNDSLDRVHSRAAFVTQFDSAPAGRGYLSAEVTCSTSGRTGLYRPVGFDGRTGLLLGFLGH